jgi:hypothetical protein
VVGVLLYWVSRAFPALAAVVTGVPFVAYFLCAHISLWMCAFIFGSGDTNFHACGLFRRMPQ